MFKAFLTLSILVHLALIVPIPLISPPEEPEPPKVTATGDSIRFNIKEYKDNATVDCPDYYVGIGVTLNFFRVIIGLAPNTPADRAGLLVGDTLLTEIPLGELQPKQELRVDYTRDGMLYSVTIIVDKICRGGSND